MEESREPEVDIEPLVTMTSSSNPAAQLLEVMIKEEDKELITLTQEEIEAREREEKRRKYEMLKEFQCSVCAKYFHRAADLKRHSICHTGLKPYACQIIHEKDRPYVCSLCGKTFARPDTYKLHMKRHDGYRPYACHICSRTFTQAYHYRNHMDIHNNSNTNICTICDKSFSDRGSLNRHRRKSFSDRGSLNRHRRKVHKMPRIPASEQIVRPSPGPGQAMYNLPANLIVPGTSIAPGTLLDSAQQDPNPNGIGMEESTSNDGAIENSASSNARDSAGLEATARLAATGDTVSQDDGNGGAILGDFGGNGSNLDGKIESNGGSLREDALNGDLVSRDGNSDRTNTPRGNTLDRNSTLYENGLDSGERIANSTAQRIAEQFIVTKTAGSNNQSNIPAAQCTITNTGGDNLQKTSGHRQINPESNLQKRPQVQNETERNLQKSAKGVPIKTGGLQNQIGHLQRERGGVLGDDINGDLDEDGDFDGFREEGEMCNPSASYYSYERTHYGSSAPQYSSTLSQYLTNILASCRR
ncbi:hypothetical protein M8J75_000115 [Diaphorina citri]|nr:hypothetical protein M8J75_000115 [Diaphorina citri]